MTNYEKLMQIMPKETLAHLLVEKGTYDDGDYVFDGEDEHCDSWEVEYFRFLDEYYETEEEACQRLDLVKAIHPPSTLRLEVTVFSLIMIKNTKR